MNSFQLSLRFFTCQRGNASQCWMCDGHFQWERAFFRQRQARNLLVDWGHILHNKQYPWDLTAGESLWQLPQGLRLRHDGEVAAFAYFSLYHVHRSNREPILMHLLRKCLLGSLWHTISLRESTFPSKVQKFAINLAGSRKTHERFSADLHEGSNDGHQVYLKLRGQRPGRMLFTQDLVEICLGVQNLNIRSMGKSKPNELTVLRCNGQHISILDSANCATPQML